MKRQMVAGVAAALAWAAAAAAEGLIGADLAAFRDPVGEWKVIGDAAKDSANGARLSVKDGAGAMYNGPNGRTSDILTREEFGDVEVHVEFMVPEKSNSGVYLMGRYEVQILDSFGVEKPGHGDCGGIYQRWAGERGFEGRPPRVNASRPAGQWLSGFRTAYSDALAPDFNRNSSSAGRLPGRT